MKIFIPIAATILISCPIYAEAMTHTDALLNAALSGNAASLHQLQQAAQQGSPSAQDWLGVYYATKNHYHKANHWYRKAIAAHGYARAEYYLGYAYYKGQGVPQNDVTADHWYRKAAEQGFGEAEYTLGVVYSKGQGVPQNYVTANHWYRKAAAQGYSVAEYSLGNAYYKGQGVPQSSTQALYWFQKAAAHGDVEAEIALTSLKTAINR